MMTSMTRSWTARGGAAVRKVVSGTMRRLRERGWSALTRASRLTCAAVLAYLAAEAVGLTEPPPLIAALTALIVVQVTLTGTLVNGAQRVLSVVAGVALAVGFASVVGLTWWSLGALVAASIVLGQLLRLGPHLVEVPISAMLVLGVGFAAGAEMAAAERALETLVGAVTGLLVNVVVPPAVQSRYAGRAIQKLADEIATLLETAAAEFPGGLSTDTATHWLEDARRLNRHVPRVDRALAHAEESRQLNIRALAGPDRAVGLRDGLDALEHCSVTVRSLFRSVLDAARADSAATDAGVDEQHREQLQRTHADLFTELADSVRAFGRLLGAEVDGHGPREEEAALGDALGRLRATRARAADLLLVDPREHPAEWELNADLAQAVDRMLAELDVSDHARVRDELRRARAARHLRAAETLSRLRHPGGAPDGSASGGGP